MKAYKVDTYRYKLNEMEVERFTPKMVVINKNLRQYRFDGIYQWFETYQEAKDFLIKRIKQDIEGKTNAIKALNTLLENIKAL